MLSRTAVVADPQGIHALRVHEFRDVAGRYSSSVWILFDGSRSSLARPLELLALGIGPGAVVTVVADGIDEAETLAAICLLIEQDPQLPFTNH